jgi:hypothetical protein
MEFPRNTYSDYTDADRPREVLTTRWELEDEDVAAIEEQTGAGSVRNREVILTKGYTNTLGWSIELDRELIVHHFIEESNLTDEEASSLYEAKTDDELVAMLKATSSPSEGQSALLRTWTKAFPKGSAEAVDRVLTERLPTFLYFGNYEAMKGVVSLQQIASAKSNNALSMPDRIFEALLEMAGTSVKEIQNINRFEPLIAKLEAVSNRLTREIFRYWSQNKHLAIEFRFDAARAQDPPPFNEGFIFRTRIRNTRHGATSGTRDMVLQSRLMSAAPDLCGSSLSWCGSHR